MTYHHFCLFHWPHKPTWYPLWKESKQGFEYQGTGAQGPIPEAGYHTHSVSLSQTVLFSYILVFLSQCSKVGTTEGELPLSQCSQTMPTSFNKGVLDLYCMVTRASQASASPSLHGLGILITKKREKMVLGGKDVKEESQLFPFLVWVRQLQEKSLFLYLSYPACSVGSSRSSQPHCISFHTHTYAHAHMHTLNMWVKRRGS